MSEQVLESFDKMMWALDNVQDVVEVRVNNWLYQRLMLKAGHYNSKGYPAFKSVLVFTTDYKDIPIVEDENVKLWSVVRKSDLEDELKPIIESRSLLPKNPYAKVQAVTTYEIEDTTDGERCVILFALEEGMLPVIHSFVGWRKAEELLKEFSEHHTITLQNYAHMSEVKFRPLWISVNRETHMLQKIARIRHVEKEG